MEEERELNEKIMAIMLMVQEKYPELTVHLTEMPVNISESKSAEINLSTLRSYYDSLVNLVENYKREQENNLNKN